MLRPLVSVMLPAFNAEATLPLALGSLAAQSLDDWECIGIDDGSRDRTWDVLAHAAAGDPRFRVERFTENRGRGAARQRALELVSGKYLAFLDADDWMYPERLAHEATWLDLDPTIAAVSVCAAVTRSSDQLIGVLLPRGEESLPFVRRFDEPVPPPLVFPASMIDAELARRTGFDPALRRSQDSDFLMRALLGRHIAHSARVLYAYSADASTLNAALEGYRYRIQAHLRHLPRYPLRVTKTVAETGLKIAAYRVLGLVGAEHQLIARRFGTVDETTAREFDRVLPIVRAATAQLFG
jgi:glycosyltransferase involved in cell wall biosynthesis